MKQLAKYGIVVVITAISTLYIAKNFTHYFDTPIIQYQSAVTEKEVIDQTKFPTTNQSTRAVIKEIEKAREDKLPAYKTNIQQKDIQNAVNKTGAEIALIEPSEKHTGYNVYSIRVNKHKRALGIYAGTNLNHAHSKYTWGGIHYRIGRTAYGIGRNMRGDTEIRFTWEAIQW